jgi:hypothetical protein
MPGRAEGGTTNATQDKENPHELASNRAGLPHFSERGEWSSRSPVFTCHAIFGARLPER